MKSGFFWDVTPYGSFRDRRFEATYRLHHQGETNQWAGNDDSSNYKLLLTLFLARWFFHPDDEGDMLLRNVRPCTSHTASHPDGRHSSSSCFFQLSESCLLNVAAFAHCCLVALPTQNGQSHTPPSIADVVGFSMPSGQGDVNVNAERLMELLWSLHVEVSLQSQSHITSQVSFIQAVLTS
jgi:hypothetical protein